MDNIKKDNKTYRWITNINKEKIQHFRIVCKALDVDVVIAKYKEPICIEATYGVYVLNDYETATKIRAIFELDCILGEEYKKRMIDRGFATEEEMQEKHCYIGCEKEYFPNRDTTVLRIKEKDMIYKYREVKCPWCEHVFMWNNNEHEGLVLHEYKLKRTGEFVEKAKCPKCNMDMIVLEHVFEGIDVDDNRIEAVGIKRI